MALLGLGQALSGIQNFWIGVGLIGIAAAWTLQYAAVSIMRRRRPAAVVAPEASPTLPLTALEQWLQQRISEGDALIRQRPTLGDAWYRQAMSSWHDTNAWQITIGKSRALPIRDYRAQPSHEDRLAWLKEMFRRLRDPAEPDPKLSPLEQLRAALAEARDLQGLYRAGSTASTDKRLRAWGRTTYFLFCNSYSEYLDEFKGDQRHLDDAYLVVEFEAQRLGPADYLARRVELLERIIRAERASG